MYRYDKFWLLRFMKLRWILSSCSVLTALIVKPFVVQACSVCISGSDPAADAFNSSVLFLMVIPYLVVGSIAGGLFYAYRRGLAKREQTETTERLVPLAWNEKESGR
jgi:hypothetical protein